MFYFLFTRIPLKSSYSTGMQGQGEEATFYKTCKHECRQAILRNSEIYFLSILVVRLALLTRPVNDISVQDRESPSSFSLANKRLK